MKTTLAMILRHSLIRFRAIVSNPAALALMLMVVLLATVFWPSTTGPDGKGWTRAIFGDRPLEVDLLDVMVGFLWIWMWPIIPITTARGRVAGPSGSDALGMRAMPTLPLGPRARVLAEVLTVSLFLLAGRLPGLFLPFSAPPAEYLGETLLGFLLVLPILVTYALPTTSVNWMWTLGAAMVGLLFAAMKAGLLASPVPLAVTCLLLSGIPLFLAGRRELLPRIDLRARGKPDARWRPASHPETRFRRDLWLLPFRRYGVLLAAVALLEAVLLVLDAAGELPGWTFYIASNFALAFAGSMVLLKPLGDDLLAQSMVGKKGSRFGDFRRAWALLPVAPERVLRGVYLHGLLSSLGLWLTVLLLVLLRTYLKAGIWALHAEDGESVAKFILPVAALVPLASGLLVSVAAGNKLLAILSGGAALAFFNVPIPCLVVASQFFPRGSRGPEWIALGALLTFTVIGSLPQLMLLRNPRKGANRMEREA